MVGWRLRGAFMGGDHQPVASMTGGYPLQDLKELTEEESEKKKVHGILAAAPQDSSQPYQLVG